MDQIVNADDAVLAQSLFNNFIVVNGDSLLVDLSKSSLKDEISDGLSGRISVGNVRFDFSQKIYSGLVDSDEAGVVELSELQELEDLSDLRRESVDTSDSDDNDDLSFSGDVERSISSSLSSLDDGFSSLSEQSVSSGFGSLSVFFSSRLEVSNSVSGSLFSLSSELSVSFSSFLDVFRNLLFSLDLSGLAGHGYKA